MSDLTKLTAKVARDKDEGFTWQRYAVCDIAALLERLEQCEAALKPFAALAKEVDLLRHPDESTCLWAIKAGDLRAARAALEEK